MRHTIYKWFWAWDFEKEEKWLNEMSAKGMQLVAVGFCKYMFEETAPSEYIYRLELLENAPSHSKSIAYIQFLEETGVEYIGSYMRWVYFRKKVTYGAFDLYSDIGSKIKQYKRIITLLLFVIPINLWSALLNFRNSISIGFTASIVSCILSSLMVLLLGVGVITIGRKIRILEKEKAIRE